MSKKSVLSLLVLIFVGVIIYANSLNVPFVFDDSDDIRDNTHIRISNLSPTALLDAGFKSPAPARFVAYISFALNYYFHGYALPGYHAVNIAIHVLTGFFLFLLIRVTLATPALAATEQRADAVALAAALLWLVNPTHTQSVTYVVQRMNAMAAMFYLLALYLYAKGRHGQLTAHGSQHVPGEQKTVGEKAIGDGRWAMGTTTGSPVPQASTAASRLPNIPTPRRPNSKTPKHPITKTPKHRNTRTPEHPAGQQQYPAGQNRQPFWYFTGAAASGLLALGSKQIAATLPVFILVYEWFFFQDLDGQWVKKRLRMAAVVAVVILLLSVVFIATNRVALVALTDYQDNQFTIFTRMLTQLRVVLFYAGLFFFPHPSRLNLDHDFTLSQGFFSPPTTLIALLVIAGLLIVAVKTARKNRILAFAILWYFGNLVIESSVIPLALIFEHRLYLPSVALAWLTIHYGSKIPKPYLAYALLAVVVGLWGLWTHQRNTVWQDPLNLWADAVAKAPGKARAHYNLAEQSHGRKDLTRALEHYQKAIAIKPDYQEAHTNLAILYKEMGKVAEAGHHFETALRLKPADAMVRLNYGTYLVETGRGQEALEHLFRGLELGAQRPEAWLIVADKLLALGMVQDAVKHYAKAAAMNPNSEMVQLNYGTALLSVGRNQEAIDQYHKAVAINSDNADTHYNLANAFAARQQTAQAATHYQRALHLNPNHLQAHSNYGGLLLAAGKRQEALAHFIPVVKMDPELAEGHYNIGTVLVKLDRPQQALPHLEKALRLKPDHTDAHLNAGVCYSRLGRFDRAVDHFRQALQLAPESIPARANAEMAAAALAKAIGAAAQLAPTHPAQPASAPALFEMARRCEAIGDHDRAIAFYTGAIGLEPRFNMALTRLVDVYMELGQLDHAAALLAQMQGYWPDSPSVHFTTACLLARQNRAAAAVEALEAALNHGLADWELLAVSPLLDNLRRDPGFVRLVKR